MTNNFPLKLLDWSAWSPQYSKRQDWLNWQEQNFTAVISPKNSSPKNANVTPMLRRRTSRLSKMALEVSNDLLAKNKDSLDYAIFCTRHGELNRSLVLLQSLLKKEPLSPMIFAQSVHNTASGLFGIANKQIMPTTSIAAKDCCLEQGWIEAYAYLQCYPEQQVLLVAFDETIPSAYEAFTPSYDDIAIALILSANTANNAGQTISLNQRQTNEASKEARTSSSEWLFMQHLLQAEFGLRQRVTGTTLWQWQIG